MFLFVIQPLDQAEIIKNFKVHYRKYVVRHMLDAIEKLAEMQSVSILQAMRMASSPDMP